MFVYAWKAHLHIQLECRTLVTWEAMNVNCEVAILCQLIGICPRFEGIFPVKLFVCLFFDMSHINKQIVSLVICQVAVRISLYSFLLFFH